MRPAANSSTGIFNQKLENSRTRELREAKETSLAQYFHNGFVMLQHSDNTNRLGINTKHKVQNNGHSENGFHFDSTFRIKMKTVFGVSIVLYFIKLLSGAVTFGQIP